MYNVVIADDEEIILSGLARLMDWGSIDCSVVGRASNGIAALDAIKKFKPDIAILDQKMPGMSGLDVASAVKREKLPTEVIILSGYSDFEFLRSAVQCGIVDYVPKPTNQSTLFDAVKLAMERCDAYREMSTRQQKLEHEADRYCSKVRYYYILGLLEGQKTQGYYPAPSPDEALLGGSYVVVIVRSMDLKNHADILSDYLKNNYRGNRCYYLEYQDDFIIIHSIDSAGEMDGIRETYSELSQSMKFIGLATEITVSEMHHGEGEFISAYQEACGPGDNADMHSGGNLLVTEAKQYINSNYGDKIKLDDIANCVHINTSYLCRIFKKETGMSPLEYLNRIRIENAKDLLIRTDEKNSVIASMVGIDDPNYFSIIFKKAIGLSPLQYRRQSRNKLKRG